MILCEEDCRSQPVNSLHWSDSTFVLAATCTVTVSAVLNLGLSASTVFVGVATKHLITLQLCFCGIIACTALSCHIHQIWQQDEFGSPLPYPVPCKILDLATLFSHCFLVCLMLLDLRFSHRKLVLPLLSIISWCMIALVSLAAGINCSPTSAILVFCLYVLHIPLIILLIINQRSSRIVAPLGVILTLRPSSVKRTVPQILLLFVGTMPQAFLMALEAMKMKPFPSADAWCCLMTSLFAAFRPLFDAIFNPELGDAVFKFISSVCRRKDSS